jgi:cell division protein FtsQ
LGLQNRKIVRWMITTFWLAIGVGTVFLLVAASRKKEEKKCAGIYISIHGVSNNFFVDKKDIMDSIEAMVGRNPAGEKINSFDLRKIEKGLTANVWVKSAQLFFDNNEKLQVNVLEREPIARIFSRVGTTFYIDSSIEILPLSEKFSARLPVFTDFPSDRALVKADSDLLVDIKDISLAIQKDSFCMAMIDQIDITPERTFNMVPKIGNQTIVFGDGNDIEDKLNNLRLFYQKVITKTGWNYYSTIGLQYKDQVIAKRKGAEDRATDSLRTLQLMQTMAANAKKLSEDSSQITINDNSNNVMDARSIQRSSERDDAGDDADTAATEPNPVKHVDAKPVDVAPAVKVIKPNEVQPKADKPVVKPAAAKPKDPSPAKAKKPEAVIKKPVEKPVAKPTDKKATEKKPEVKAVVKPKPAEKPKATSMSPKEKAEKNDY